MAGKIQNYFSEHTQAIKYVQAAAIMVAIVAILALGVHLAPISLLAGITFVATKIMVLPLLVYVVGFGIAFVAIAPVIVSKKYNPTELLSAAIEAFYNKEIKKDEIIASEERSDRTSNDYENLEELNRSIQEYKRFRILFQEKKDTIEDAALRSIYRDDFETLKGKVLNAKEKLIDSNRLKKKINF